MTIQTYKEIVEKAWIRYYQECKEASLFVDLGFHTTTNFRTLKTESIEHVFGDDINAPKAVVFVGLRKSEVFIPGIIVSEASPVFEKEIKREILKKVPYKLNVFDLNYSRSPGRSYFLLSNGNYRKDTISNEERKRLEDFTEDCIDLAILFADKEFRQVCDEFSRFPKKLAERYVKDLQLRCNKKE